MKKILAVFTGGTIGSKKNNKTINVDESSSYYLLGLYKSHIRSRNVEFDTLQPLNILSENLLPDDWMVLYNCLSGMDFSAYSGIIITHGTDTLPFTSAAVSYMFNNTPIPIMITASNYPLEDKASNGLRNFISCVDFILDNPLPGVFVIFENNRGESVVYLGTRLTQAVPFTNEFDSVNSICFGKMDERKFLHNPDETNPSSSSLETSGKRPHLQKTGFTSDILYIKPHPGLNYSYYDFTMHKPKAVLHDLYHSGTACTRTTSSREYSLVDFTRKCMQNGIDVYISPIRNISGDMYVTSSDLIDCGAIPLQNISVEAAIVKLMLAYGSLEDKQKIREFLNSGALFYEYI